MCHTFGACKVHSAQELMFCHTNTRSIAVRGPLKWSVKLLRAIIALAVAIRKSSVGLTGHRQLQRLMNELAGGRE